jgi:Flp pilus assembly protein TadD
LPAALQDCNTAMKKLDKSSSSYGAVADSRALVLLRMGDYDGAIASYTLALQLRPKDAGSFYGRGISELRLHKASAGNADIAQATALSADVAESFRQMGITP